MLLILLFEGFAMLYIWILTLIIVGFVAANTFFEKKVPQTKAASDFINPYASWIGLVSLVLGIYWFLRILFNLGSMLKWMPAYTIIWLVSALLLVVVGFLLAQNLLREFSGKNAKVNEMLNSGVDKFAPLKEKLGLAAIGAGLLDLLLRITS